MKKKTAAFALIIALLAIAIVGASMAYFTDTDDATNTFSVGNVKIDLIEQQRELDENGKPTIDGALEDFEQDKILMPIVGSAQGEKDSNGLPKAGNYVDKVATVKNTGKSSALVRFYFAIPSALDDGYETFNAGANVLHFNFGSKDGASTYDVTWNWKHSNKWNYYETTIDGVPYNVYFANYKEILPAGETTTQAICGVYLDKSFDAAVNEDGDLVYSAFNAELEGLEALTDSEGNLVVNCPVYAIAVQADGFDVNNADAAFDAAYGANFNPWGTAASNWQ